MTTAPNKSIRSKYDIRDKECGKITRIVWDSISIVACHIVTQRASLRWESDFQVQVGGQRTGNDRFFQRATIENCRKKAGLGWMDIYRMRFLPCIKFLRLVTSLGIKCVGDIHIEISIYISSITLWSRFEYQCSGGIRSRGDSSFKGKRIAEN